MYSSCCKVKLAVHYNTCGIKFRLIPGFSLNFFLDISQIFFSIKMKIKLKLTLYFDFFLVSKLIWSRNSPWNKTSTQMFQKITYNTIILVQRAIKFLNLNFLYISKVLVFLDYILSRALTFSIKRKYLSKNFITLQTKKTVYK